MCALSQGEQDMKQPDVDFLIRLSLLACMFECGHSHAHGPSVLAGQAP